MERTTRYVLLVHLPLEHTADTTRDGVVAAMAALPAELRQSPTWDQDKEMARHLQITTATAMDVYSRSALSVAAAPTRVQRALARLLPKGTNLFVHSADASRRSKTSSTTGPARL